MEIKYTIAENRTVYPLFSKIGNKGEKGVNILKFDIKNPGDKMKFYLYFDGIVKEIKNGVVVVDEELTKTSGEHTAFIIGTDAKPGQKIKDGTQFFKSNKTIMKVG